MSNLNTMTPRDEVAAERASPQRLEKCPSCGSHDLKVFHEVRNVPANSCLLFDSKEEALGCPKSNIALSYCGECDFIFNADFDQRQIEYSGRYEETQGFSPTFSKFHRQLAADIIERHGLHGREVMEIGCGKGEFLVLLSQLGENRGIGVDPSALPGRLEGVEGAERVTLIPEYFTPEHCQSEPDFLCCKMTLEHITDTGDFISTVRGGLTVEKGTVVFFQVPEAYRILEDCAFEDIYHEHCSYFTPYSLTRLFQTCGFRVTRIAQEYGDQYLTIEAVAEDTSIPQGDFTERGNMASLVDSFPERMAQKQADWAAMVEEAHAKSERVVLWGSGSKAVSFLTTLGVSDLLDCVTDINPNRQDYFMPGTGHKIVAPAELGEIQPGLVIAMNRIYRDEIQADLDRLGVTCRLECL